MASIETIGIGFDTSGLKQGQAALSDTEKAATKTTQTLEKTSKETKKLSDESSTAAASSKLFASAIGAVAVSATALKAIQLADEYTNLNSRLKLVTSSTTELAAAHAALFQVAQNTRTSLTATVDMYTALARATKDIGLSQKQLVSITDTFNKAIVISGGSTASAAAAITQFNQAMASGVLRGEEFNSVSEQAPRIIDILASSLDKTRGELRAMAEAGQLTSDVVLPAILKGAKDLTAEFERMPITVAGAWQQIENATLQWVGTADSATGSSRGLSSALSDIATLIQAVSIAMSDSSTQTNNTASAWDAFTVVLQGVGIAVNSVVGLIKALGTGMAGVAAAQTQFLSGNGDFKGAWSTFKMAIDDMDAIAAATENVNNKLMNYKGTVKEANANAAKLSETQNNAAAASGKLTTAFLGMGKEAEKASKKSEELAAVTAKYNAAAKAALGDPAALAKLESHYNKLTGEIEKKYLPAVAKKTDAEKEAARAAKSAAKDQERAAAEAQRAWEKSADAYVAAMGKINDQYNKSIAASNAMIQKAKDEAEQYGLTRKQVDDLVIAKNELALAELGFKQITEGTTQARELEIDALKRHIDALKQVSSLKDEVEMNKSAMELQKSIDKFQSESLAKATANAKQTSETVSNSITEALMRGFENGKDIAKNFTDTLKNMFKSLVLQPIVKFGVDKVLGGLGLGGLSGAGGGGLDVGGMLSGAGSLLSKGADAIGLGGALSKLTGSLGGLASSVTAAVPYIGLVLGAFSMLKNAFKGETRSGAGFSANAAGQIWQSGAPSGGDFTGGAAGKSLVEMIKTANGILSAVGSKISVTGAYGGLETSTKGKGGVFAGGFLSSGETFGKTFAQSWRGNYSAEEAAKAYANDLNGAIIDALKKSDIPDAVRSVIDAGGDVSEIISKISQQAAVVKQFGELISLMPFANLAVLGYDAKNALLELNGGLEGLAGSINTYYENFYTENERSAQSLKNMTDALATVGVAVPASRDAFRALVESQDLTTEAGRKTYSTLLQVAGTFAELNPLIVENTKVTTDNADALRLENEAKEKAAQIANERYGLETQLLQVQGNTTELRRRELEQLDPSNRSIQERIWALQDEASAAEKAAAAIQKIIQAADTQRSLLNQFDPNGAVGRAYQQIEGVFAQFGAPASKIPQTAEGLTALVKSLDLTTEEGRAALDALNGLSGAFSTIYNQKSKVEEVAKTTTSTVATAVDGMKAINDAVKQAIQSMMGQSEQFATMQQQQAKATLQTALAVAKAGGSISNIAGFEDALKFAQNIDQGKYGSALDYQREYGQVLGLLLQLDQYTKPKGSHANGLASVPYDGYMAQLHKGEQVLTAREVKSGGIAGDQIAQMRGELKAMLIPILEENTRMRKRLDQWDGDGLPKERVEA